jgi:hypothetical protein
METNLETAEAQMIKPVIKSKPLILQPLFVVVLSLAVVAVAGIAFLYQKNTVLQKDFDEQATAITKLTLQVGSYKSDIEKISDINNRSTATAKMAYLSYVQHDIEGGVVTDDFVVDKVYLTPNQSGDNVSIIINIDTQPAMAIHHQGKGTFDIADRELRAKSLAIINAVKERYITDGGDNLPAWDDNNVHLTIKNYAIGDTASGEFKLVGEK